MPRDPQTIHFVTLLTGFQSRLYAFILSLTADSNLAADLLQETNVVLWEKADRFTPGSDFAAWAFAIARYQVLAARQRLARDRLLFDDAMMGDLAEDAAAATADLDDRLLALAHCMDTLTERHGDLIRRRYGQSQSVAAIAQSVGMGANTVAQALHRARLALMRCIRNRLREQTS